MHKSNDNALIIFARNPFEGKVKTRLAKDVGNTKALKVYISLLNHTFMQTKNLSADKFLFLSENTDGEIFDNTFTQFVQIGSSLGERMMNAFNIVFEKEYKRVLIAGTDCPGLTEEIIETAFEDLMKYHFTIGPSSDGGYYLLGMNEPNDYVFENIEWSNEHVLDKTIDKIKAKHKSYNLLKELNDIDNEKDLNSFVDFKFL
ncbi:MAG: TIGR04282 family arsenosugar biosynthesis glycosyltransferase [Ignavibacteria bacterium]